MFAVVRKAVLIIISGGFALVLAACGPSPAEEEAPRVVLTATGEVQVTTAPTLQGTRIRQWASGGEASSEFAVPEWGAEKALGPPDAPGCGDYQFAWASAASDAVATLTLNYAIPVYITEIHVVESFNPDQVVQVEVLRSQGEFHTVYESEPRQVDRPCPYRLIVPVGPLDFKSDTIRITVDQSVLGLGWNEIDAVQLIGDVEG